MAAESNLSNIQEETENETEDSAFENLTDEEILLAIKEQDNMEAQNYLINKYRNFVRAKARSYFLIGADREDIIQEGMIGLFKAIQTYDPAGGASFKTYMNICVHNQILNAIEAATAKKHTPLNSSGDLSAAWDIPADVSSNPDELAIYSDTMQLILSDDGKLRSPMEKQVARMLADGHNYREIAAQLGRSPKSVDNTIQRIRRKLKDFFD